MRIVHRLVTVALMSLALFGSPAVAEAQTPTRLFVFGDSLSDTGNDLLATLATPTPIPPPQMYAQGRFSNGPVTFEYLWSMLSGRQPFIAPSLSLSGQPLPPAGAVSFAFGGAGSGVVTVVQGFQVPGLQTQIAMFQAALRGQPAPADALYAIWVGSNDYEKGPGEAVVPPATVVGNIADAVGALYGLGARDIVVVNLPDLGASPSVLLDSAQRELLSALTTAHNKLLAKTMREIEKRLPGLTIIDGDAAKFVKRARHELVDALPLVDTLVGPLPGGLPASECRVVAPALCPAVASFEPDAPFLFWDNQHPTTAADERFAEVLFTAVTKALRHP
jgi:phospholipase/lecithinase/hemolysin